MYKGLHSEFEPGKAQYSTPNFFDQLFFETQNLRQAQALGALPAVAALIRQWYR